MPRINKRLQAVVKQHRNARKPKGFDPLAVFRIAMRIVPFVTAFVAAVREDSPGGKRITRAEASDMFSIIGDIVIDELDIEIGD